MTATPPRCARAIAPMVNSVTDWHITVNFYAEHLSVDAALNRPAGTRRSWPAPADLDRTGPGPNDLDRAGGRRSWPAPADLDRTRLGPNDLDRTRADLPTLDEARARRHQ